ncbi:DUF6183 family protein [Streptomyces sp. I6]|uniref:DUF6183 family protein n=1 Tax=Streptomyces sp. I6 TaxID=2483113 RepID=UPI000F457246|nr:DUF6183 family protein [Streptomyces sp. I6]RNL71198.1 hypothetical protein EBF04_09330 [Streptomyces sp. I6]
MQQFMSRLALSDNTQASTAEVSRRVAAGDLDWTGAVADAIASQGGSQAWQHEDLYLHLQRALAKTLGIGNIQLVVRLPLVLRPDVEREKFVTRLMAVELARHQSAEDLARAVFEAAPDPDVSYELRACLLHELVRRPVAVEEHPALRSFAAVLAADGHPLAQLPCHLLPLEQVERDSSWFPFGPVSRVPKEPLSTPLLARRRAADTTVTEVRDPDRAASIGTAVREWTEVSNGRVAAHVFTVQPPLDPRDFGALFGRLPLACRSDTPELWTTTADTVLDILRSAASSGGAYSNPLFGTYGRLAAWQSLAGLVGLSPQTPVPQIAREAEHTHWFLFDTEADWFDAVAWDLAIAALRPGGTSGEGQEIAVLAATDTD